MNTITPKRRLILEFTKMHGAGNDFVVLDNRFYNFSEGELTALARRLCARRTGVGADGLLALATPEEAGHDYRMHYLNADGSRAMCGNGARCLAAFARNAGLDGEVLTFESEAGVSRARVADDGGFVRLFVPAPRDFTPARALQGTAVPESVPYVWTGTHHAVVFTDDLPHAPVDTLGPAIRKDGAFAPRGTNVNFVEVVGAGAGGEPARLRVRTFEKGVEAETRACGTGALAAAVTARLAGRTESDTAAVEVPGGMLTVGFQFEGEAVSDLYLEGPVATVFRGTLEV